MYPVSEAYKTAISKNTTRKTKMTGTITLIDETIIDINNDTLIQLEINNQCVSRNDFQLGSVYIGQLNISIKTEMDRNKFYEAIATPIFNLQLEDGTFEEVPLGVFIIKEANRIGKTIKMTGDDFMSKLNVKTKILLSGFTIVQMLQHISEKTSIPVSQNTYDNISALSPVDSNGNLIAFTTNKNNKNTTYRDVLSYCSELCGGFAYINRLGEIEIKRYSKSPDKTIDDSIRNRSEFSDFEITYGNLEANIYTKNKKGEEILESESYSFFDDANAFTYTLSNNPYISRQSNEQKREWIYQNIENAIEGIIYTPSEVAFLGDAALELGDMVAYVGYNTNNTTIYSLVHSYEFNYRRSCKIKCVGQNQSIAKADKMPGANLSDSQESQSLLSFLPYTNMAQVDIGDTKVALCTFDPLYVTDNNLIQVNGGLTMHVTTPGTFELVYSINEIYNQFYPRQIISMPGYHYIPIFYMISDIDPAIANQFKIYMLSQDGGVASIQPYQFMVSLLSQSMSDVVKEWSGKLTFKERISSGFTIGPVFMDNQLTETVIITQGGQSITDMGLTYSFVTSSGAYLTSAQVNQSNAASVIGVAITGKTFVTGTVTELNIPNTYTTNAAEKAAGLANSYNIIHLGDGCLFNAGLSKITIPKYVTDIKYQALKYNALTDITCPIQAKWFGDNISYKTGYLKNITITPGETGYGVDMEAGGWNYYQNTAWYLCNDYGFTLTIEEGVKSIGRYGLHTCRVQHLTLPSTLERIEDFGLYNAHILNISIPASVTYLGFWAIANCYYLTSLNYSGTQTQFQLIAGYAYPSSMWGYFLNGSGNAVINYES